MGQNCVHAFVVLVSERDRCCSSQELLKHTSECHRDFADLTGALQLVSAAASHNNEHIRSVIGE
jgi:hypothetical protein